MFSDVAAIHCVCVCLYAVQRVAVCAAHVANELHYFPAFLGKTLAPSNDAFRVLLFSVFPRWSAMSTVSSSTASTVRTVRKKFANDELTTSVTYMTY